MTLCEWTVLIAILDNELERDIHFYHFVLARELKRVQSDMISSKSPVQYSWNEWEFFLLLMGNGPIEYEKEFPGQQIADILAPAALQSAASPFKAGGAFAKHDDAPPQNPAYEKPETDGLVDRETQRKEKWNMTPNRRGLLKKRPTADPLGDWSWLDQASPLLSSKSESEWIADKLSAALVRELNRRRRGWQRKPPISMGHIRRGRDG
jgi:potassium channel subfamily K